MIYNVFFRFQPLLTTIYDVLYFVILHLPAPASSEAPASASAAAAAPASASPAAVPPASASAAAPPACASPAAAPPAYNK